MAPCDGLHLPGGGSGGGADVGEFETPLDEIVHPCINAYCDGEPAIESAHAGDGGQSQAGAYTGLAVELRIPPLDEIPVAIVMDLGAVDGPAPGSW